MRSENLGQKMVKNVCSWSAHGGANEPVRLSYHAVVEALVKFALLLRTMAYHGLPMNQPNGQVTLVSALEKEQEIREQVQTLFRTFEE